MLWLLLPKVRNVIGVTVLGIVLLCMMASIWEEWTRESISYSESTQTLTETCPWLAEQLNNPKMTEKMRKRIMDTCKESAEDSEKNPLSEALSGHYKEILFMVFTPIDRMFGGFLKWILGAVAILIFMRIMGWYPFDRQPPQQQHSILMMGGGFPQFMGGHPYPYPTHAQSPYRSLPSNVDEFTEEGWNMPFQQGRKQKLH